MDIKAVLLDTSFIIRLLSESDNLHDNAKAYYKHFLEHGVEMKFSTISIAEYCVIGDVAELPLRNLKIIPFNFDHAQRAGQFAAKVYSARNGGQLPEIKERMLIPNDTKLFSQADLDSSIQYFVTSDTKSKSVFTLLSSECGARFQHLDIHKPVNEFLGVLF